MTTKSIKNVIKFNNELIDYNIITNFEKLLQLY